MQAGSDALVIHTIRNGEQAAIVRLFTKQFGLLSFLVKGVFSRKSPKAALLQPMNTVHIQFRLKENSDLLFAGEIKGVSNYRNIPFLPGSLAQLSFINEVLYKTLRHREADEVLFDYLGAMLQMLDEAGSGIPDFHLRFLIDYTHFLGFGIELPEGNSVRFFDPIEGDFASEPAVSRWSRESTQCLIAIASGNPRENASQINRQRRNELLGLLLAFYRHHIPAIGDLKSPEVLQAVFE
jgi:DNA repair protein RecO (recombination protein O)